MLGIKKVSFLATLSLMIGVSSVCSAFDLLSAATGGVVHLDGPVFRTPSIGGLLHPGLPGNGIIPNFGGVKIPVVVPPILREPLAKVLPYIAPSAPVEVVDLPHELTPEGSIERATRLLDVGQDIITFGAHGRERDKARAEQDEALANAQLAGTQNTKDATANGAKAQLEQAKQSIKMWEEFNSKIKSIADYQKQLVNFSTRVFTCSIDTESVLKSMGAGLQDAKEDLQIMVQGLSNSGPSQDKFSEAEAWDKTIIQVAKVIENSHEDIQHYLNRAILSADGQVLGKFIGLISQSRDRIERLEVDSEANLDAEKSNKANIEKQLAALN